MKRSNAKAMPINDNDYNCSYRACLTNRMGSISRHIMPLVINSLRGGHTHTHTHKHTHTHTDDPHKINFKKPGACSLRMPGLIRHVPTMKQCALQGN